jgi:hypothetical protein
MRAVYCDLIYFQCQNYCTLVQSKKKKQETSEDERIRNFFGPGEPEYFQSLH